MLILTIKAIFMQGWERTGPDGKIQTKGGKIFIDCLVVIYLIYLNS